MFKLINENPNIKLWSDFGSMTIEKYNQLIDVATGDSNLFVCGRNAFKAVQPFLKTKVRLSCIDGSERDFDHIRSIDYCVDETFSIITISIDDRLSSTNQFGTIFISSSDSKDILLVTDITLG